MTMTESRELRCSMTTTTNITADDDVQKCTSLKITLRRPNPHSAQPKSKQASRKTENKQYDIDLCV